MRAFKNRLRRLVLALGLMLLLALQTQQVLADESWKGLNPKQQELLAPVQSEWNTMSGAQKARWIKVGKKYEQESPENQAKMRERVGSWAKLSPSEKSLARENYQALKERKRGERNSSWNSYQTLEPEEKGKFKNKHDENREQSRTNPLVTPGAAAYTR